MKEKTLFELKTLKIKSFTTTDEKQIVGGYQTGRAWCSYGGC